MAYAQYDRRRLGIKLSVAIAAAVMVLSTGAAQADLGEQLAKLLPDDGAAGDGFGISVAINGTTAIVGALWNDDNGTNSGSAYLFDISDPAKPTQIFKLLADDGAAFDFFGISVAISGATAIVGAWQHDDNGSGSGSVYLFDIMDPMNPVQIAKLLADDGAAGDHFGFSVAINGAIAIVGAHGNDDNGSASGSAYLFDISDPAKPTQLARLLADDGAAGDSLGTSVAISGATAIVGAQFDDDNGSASGSAYLFDISEPANPTQIAKLLADDGAADDRFGWRVGISGATAIVGAHSHDDNGSNSGSAYLFDTTTGQQLFKLLPDDGAADDEFGFSVAISGATAIVAARQDNDNGTNSGSAYLFDISDPTHPIQIAKLLASDGAADDLFGWSVTLDGAIAIVGAYIHDDNGFNSGSAYLFSAIGGIDFEEPQEFPAFGEATVEAVGSFDAIDNDSLDVAMVIPGSDPKANGNVQVFLNQGNDDKTGDWIGLEAGALILVGTDPSDITAGFFNADDFVDLAVSNAGDDQLSILLGDGNGSFTPGTPEDVGQMPSAVASADVDLDGNIDLVVANALDNTVWLLLGDGMGGFTTGPPLPTEGSFPIDVDPGDIDNDKDVDIVGINAELAKGEPINGSVFVILNNGDGSSAPAVNYPVGIDPRQLAIADIDGDLLSDVIVVNGADATVSVLLNQGDGTFGPAIEVGVGTSPRSIDAVDLDGDGDPDLVIAADDKILGPVVQVLRNVTSDIGDPMFEIPVGFVVDADPNFVLSADFNADELPDIVTANADEGKTGGSVTVLLNDPPPLLKPCPWDLDAADGNVGVPDLLSLLAQWGADPGGPPDFDGDGIVGLSDLLELLANWGPCP